MATPPRRPYWAQGTGHAPTATIRSPGEWPHLHGGHKGPGDLPRPHGIHTECMGPTTPPCQSCGAQGNGHASTAAIRGLETWHASITSVRGPRDRPRLYGGHTSLGEWPRPHGVHTGPRGMATPPRQPYGPRALATLQRQPFGAQGTRHAFTAGIQSARNWPRLNVNHARPRGTATPPRRI